MGKGFGKAFRTLELDEWKCRWEFLEALNVFFLPFSLASISLTESCSFFTLHKLAESIVLDRQN